jgi:hypothetical protein
MECAYTDTVTYQYLAAVVVAAALWNMAGFVDPESSGSSEKSSGDNCPPGPHKGGGRTGWTSSTCSASKSIIVLKRKRPSQARLSQKCNPIWNRVNIFNTKNLKTFFEKRLRNFTFGMVINCFYEV